MKSINKCLACAFSIFAASLAFCMFAGAAEITVTPSGDSSGKTDCSNLQKALNTAQDSSQATTINITKGNYYINTRLVVKGNNTTVKAPTSAVITQVRPGTGLIRNLPTAGKYDDIRNITIDGGTWVGNTEVFGKGYSGFHFSHASGITIKNAVLKDNFRGHLIELAGVRDSTITNCILGGKYVTNDDSVDEAIQIDVTHDESLVGDLGAPESLHDVVFDDTPCENIKITNNNITYSRGIGSHSKVDNHPHKNITISGNKINSTDSGVMLYYYYYTKVYNNTITSASNGITVRTYIANNYYNANKSGEARTIKDENNYGIEVFSNNFASCKGRAVSYTATKDYPSYYAVIKNNTISRCGGSAIVMEYLYKTPVTGNKISGAASSSSAVASSGISISGGTNNSITSNSVSSFSDNGIKLSGSSFCSLYGNAVSSVSKNGIVLMNSSYNTTVNSNKLSSIGATGIRVTGGSYNSSIKYNRITGADDRGITADTSAGVEINENTISSASGYGIHIYSNSPNCVVNSNKISATKNNGIQVSTGCSSVRILQNTINEPKGHGISIYDSTMVYMYKNKIASPRGHGICISKAENAAMSSNTISNGSKNGIYFINSNNASSYANKITKCKLNGISVYNGTCILQGNSVQSCKENGLYISRSENSTVVANALSSNRLRGIRVTSKSNGIYVADNKASGNRADGVMIDNTNNALISGNTISGNIKRYGINVSNGKKVRVSGNSISGRYSQAILISGSVKSGNINSMKRVAVGGKIKLKKSKKLKIRGSCDRNCSVRIRASGKTFKTKKVKKNKGKFISAKKVKLKPKSKIQVVQMDKAKNTFTIQISIAKK